MLRDVRPYAAPAVAGAGRGSLSIEPSHERGPAQPRANAGGVDPVLTPAPRAVVHAAADRFRLEAERDRDFRSSLSCAQANGVQVVGLGLPGAWNPSLPPSRPW